MEEKEESKRAKNIKEVYNRRKTIAELSLNVNEYDK